MFEFTTQDYEANEVRRYLEKNLLQEHERRLTKLRIIKNYSSKCITIIEKPTINNITEYRDAYYNVLDILNSDKIIGHAICLVGLKRTGKSILLSQLHSNSMSFGVEANEILHITLGVKINDRKVDRDSLNINRVQGASKIEFPKLSDIQELISELKIYQDIKCVMIDEITLCEDFILAGKSFIDGLVNSGIKVILAGTESASFIEANENSLYTRLILEDISYIPFGEYCRLKKLPLNTLEEKQNAMDRYIEHGNILDDTISVDDKYIESAVGINVALSIINTDNYRKALEVALPRTGTFIDPIIKGVEEALLQLAEKQVQDAFDQANKELLDIRSRTSQALQRKIAENKLLPPDQQKRIGTQKGDTFTTQKEIIAKERIKEGILKGYPDEVIMNNIVGDLMKQLPDSKRKTISRNTYYQYKREVLCREKRVYTNKRQEENK